MPDYFRLDKSLLECTILMMKNIWSPWRMPYIENHTKEDGCVFCNCLAESDNPENLILVREKNAFVILNRYPYTNGHLMVVPIQHVATIETLELEVLTELMQLTRHGLKVLRHVYGAEAYNVGMNIGGAAGAGIAEHVHMHLLPRWTGDTNFMTTIAQTRVLPEALEATYERLLVGWKELT
jgi:ATP adenylyltransferase